MTLWRSLTDRRWLWWHRTWCLKGSSLPTEVRTQTRPWCCSCGATR